MKCVIRSSRSNNIDGKQNFNSAITDSFSLCGTGIIHYFSSAFKRNTSSGATAAAEASGSECGNDVVPICITFQVHQIEFRLGQNTSPQCSSAFTGCAFQNVSTSNWQL